MQAHGYGTVRHLPDAINLAAYPGLVHAPEHWGDFVAFARNGKPVVDMGASAASRATSDYIGDIAEQFGVSFGDVCDALKYLRDTGAI